MPLLYRSKIWLGGGRWLDQLRVLSPQPVAEALIGARAELGKNDEAWFFAVLQLFKMIAWSIIIYQIKAKDLYHNQEIYIFATKKHKNINI